MTRPEIIFTADHVAEMAGAFAVCSPLSLDPLVRSHEALRAERDALRTERDALRTDLARERGRRLRLERSRAGKSMGDVADHLGVTVAFVSDVELARNGRVFTSEQQRALRAFLFTELSAESVADAEIARLRAVLTRVLDEVEDGFGDAGDLFVAKNGYRAALLPDAFSAPPSSPPAVHPLVRVLRAAWAWAAARVRRVG